jgi:hypothetical protein
MIAHQSCLTLLAPVGLRPPVKQAFGALAARQRASSLHKRASESGQYPVERRPRAC